MTKDERQLESVNKWREAKGRGTLNLIMRFGKTRIADMITRNFKNRDRITGTDRSILAITPNDFTKQNLIQNCEHLNKDNVWTSNKLLNYIKEAKEYPSCSLLILEEIHRLLSGETYEVLKYVKNDFILGLTGSTLTKEDISKLKVLDCPIVDSISEAEAIQNNWISHFIEYNVPVELDESDKIRYARFSELISEILSDFNGIHKRMNAFLKTDAFRSDFDLVLACFVGQSIKNKNGNKTFVKPDVIRRVVAELQGWKRDIVLDNELNQNINKYWNPDNIYERAKTFKNYVHSRNQILVYNRNKVNAVMAIINHNPNESLICFNESIEMVNAINNLFPKTSIAYHSSVESRYVQNPETGDVFRMKNGEPKKFGKVSLKKMAIEGMRVGVFKQLITAKSLNEGLTIENITRVITTGGSTNPQTHEQRASRGKTFDYSDPNKICIIINLYCDDFSIPMGEDEMGNTIYRDYKSRDKVKLQERQSTAESPVIWLKNLDDLLMLLPQ